MPISWLQAAAPAVPANKSFHGALAKEAARTARRAQANRIPEARPETLPVIVRRGTAGTAPAVARILVPTAVICPAAIGANRTTAPINALFTPGIRPAAVATIPEILIAAEAMLRTTTETIHACRQSDKLSEFRLIFYIT